MALKTLCAAVLVTSLATACSSVHTYSGTVLDARGQPMELVSVVCMRSAPVPFSEAVEVGRVTADAQGRFRVEVPKRASYLLVGGWEVSTGEAAGEEYRQIQLPGGDAAPAPVEIEP